MYIVFLTQTDYDEAEIATAFKNQNHIVDLIKMNSALTFFKEKTIHLMQEQISFVFSLSYHSQIAEICQKNHIPYVCWCRDTSYSEIYHKTIVYDTNYFFLPDTFLVKKYHIYYIITNGESTDKKTFCRSILLMAGCAVAALMLSMVCFLPSAAEISALFSSRST